MSLAPRRRQVSPPSRVPLLPSPPLPAMPPLPPLPVMPPLPPVLWSAARRFYRDMKIHQHPTPAACTWWLAGAPSDSLVSSVVKLAPPQGAPRLPLQTPTPCNVLVGRDSVRERTGRLAIPHTGTSSTQCTCRRRIFRPGTGVPHGVGRGR